MHTEPAKHDVEPAVTEIQESRQPGSLEDLQRSIEREMEQRRYRKERAEEKAKEIKLLALDPNEDIRGPVLDALGKVLPRILKRKYGVFHDLDTIIEVNGKMRELEGCGAVVTAYRLAEWQSLTSEERSAFNTICEIGHEESTGDLIKHLSGVAREWAALPENMRKLMVAIYNYSRSEAYTFEETIGWMKHIRFHSGYFETPNE